MLKSSSKAVSPKAAGRPKYAFATRRLIVIRTHFIDDHLLALARALGTADHYEIAFAVDERTGSHDSAEFSKISVTENALAAIGLDVSTGDALWRCGDYIFYLAFRAYPSADFIWLIENDVHINSFDVKSPFLLLDRNSEHDLLATYFGPAEDGWFWNESIRERAVPVYRCFFPMVRLSRRAGELLFMARCEDLQRRTVDAPLPNDESFVATLVAANGLTAADINDVANLYDRRNFTYGYPFHRAEIGPHDGCIYHPVKAGLEYLRAKTSDLAFGLKELLSFVHIEPNVQPAALEQPLYRILRREFATAVDIPDTLFSTGAGIAALLAFDSSIPILRSIFRALAQTHLGRCIDTLRAGWVSRRFSLSPLHDIALGKPALQSSVSEWSIGSDPRADAGQLTIGDLDGVFSNHTDVEDWPWWQVDLLGFYPISIVRIHNRTDIPDRLTGFIISVSFDGRAWKMVYEHDASRDAKLIETIRLSSPVIGRYLRIVIPSLTMLHLRSVEVYLPDRAALPLES